MKFAAIILVFLFTLAPLSMAQTKKQTKKGKVIKPEPQKVQNPNEAVLARTKEFMAARQARNGVLARRYFHPEDIKKLHENVKLLYISTKEGMESGQFTRKYVERSITDGELAEPYKQAILHYLLKNANFDRELDTAFTRYMGSYSYKILKFQIDKVVFSPDGKTVDATVVEIRQAPGQKQSQSATSNLKWNFKENNWYLTIDRPAHF